MDRLAKKILATAGCMLTLSTVYAQTAEWLVAPKYSKIEFIAPGLYKVYNGGKTGVVDTKGTIIISPEYDEIKPFYEGLAPFGDFTTEGFEIKGVLSENGKVYFTKGNYYLLPDYDFFSEGFIPVMDLAGKYGYLDDRCSPAFKFTRDETRPFSEGVAAVGEGDRFYWLTTTGEEIYLTLSNGGNPYGGTNFFNGKAYFWDQDGKFYIIDGNGEITRTKPRDLSVDYLYRVDSGKGFDVSYTNYQEIPDRTEWYPKQKNGLWSYVNTEGHLLSPFQYDNVKDFSEGVAVAAADGRYGLLHVVPDNSTFYTKSDKKRHVFSPGKDCKLDFTLSVPEKWQGEDLIVEIIDPETGVSYDLAQGAENTYTFNYRPSDNKAQEDKTFNVKVKNNDISLWQGEESYNFVQRAKLLSSIRLNNAEANENDICMVTATVKNPSSIPVTTTVTLSGGGTNAQFDGRTVTVEIPPHGSKSITGAFHVKKVVLGGWCSVSTSDGSSAKKSNLELKPH